MNTTTTTQALLTVHELYEHEYNVQAMEANLYGGRFVKSLKQNSDEIFITVCAALPWATVVNNMETYGDFCAILEQFFVKNIEEETRDAFAQEGMRVHVQVESLNDYGVVLHGRRS